MECHWPLSRHNINSILKHTFGNHSIALICVSHYSATMKNRTKLTAALAGLLLILVSYNQGRNNGLRMGLLGGAQIGLTLGIHLALKNIKESDILNVPELMEVAFG